MSKEQFDELNHVESVVKQFLLNNFNMKLRAQFFYNHIFKRTYAMKEIIWNEMK